MKVRQGVCALVLIGGLMVSCTGNQPPDGKNLWPIHFTARVCSATVSPDHAGGVVADLPVTGTQPNSKYFNASEVKNGRVPPGTVAGTHGGTTMA